MSDSRPSSLPENAGLAFVGEQAWPAARLSSTQAESISGAQNPTRRPNLDVLRGFIGFDTEQFHEYSQIDFPLHFTEQEAALYQEPFIKLRALQKIDGSTVGASMLATPHTPSREQARSHPIIPATVPAWWISPHAKPEIRTALARLERYLAMPLAAEAPTWNWIDSHLLPDATLLAIARDDDFTHGVLQSRFFNVWWSEYSAQLSPPEIIQAFPFPWPPATLLSALSRTQEENRHAIARASRAGNEEQIDATVAAAYGWPIDLIDGEILVQLTRLNHQRAQR